MFKLKIYWRKFRRGGDLTWERHNHQVKNAEKFDLIWPSLMKESGKIMTITLSFLFYILSSWLMSWTIRWKIWSDLSITYDYVRNFLECEKCWKIWSDLTIRWQIWSEPCFSFIFRFSFSFSTAVKSKGTKNEVKQVRKVAN